MSRIQIYKLNPAAVVVMEFIDLPGNIVSDDPIDYEKTPAIPDDLQALFAQLAKNPQPAKLVTYDNASPGPQRASGNGWSMCQSTPPIRRHAGDKKTAMFLAPI